MLNNWVVTIFAYVVLLTLCSCLIARCFLPGLRTCLEVAKYMFAGGESMPHGSIPSSIMNRSENINAECTRGRKEWFDDDGKLSSIHIDVKQLLNLGCFARTKKCNQDHGRNGKRANLGSSIILGSLLASRLDGEELLMGKTCVISSILLVGVTECVERNVLVFFMELAVKNIVGMCLKLCNNRFRGCHCAKSQCRSRLCPCFAANRECDPDVCRNCWISCGDGSLGEPPRRGDSQCGNMNLLLGQKERILLAKSDVIGWGAFAKIDDAFQNAVNKNVCLGEYTGELINPKEAEKRGKLYDRINTSFLFNWVIDARRRGDKLKFANHSSKPNCYAKVMLVGGDHRVGIFAKENIKAGDELFYDYYYDLDTAPLWALPPKTETSKKDELTISQGRTKKHQSHL
ncbi:Histone-lysine N-methyltransferase EZA1, partial [Mucuna pruriens]